MLSSLTPAELDDFEKLLRRAKNFNPEKAGDFARLADFEDRLAQNFQKGNPDAVVQKTDKGWEVTVNGEKMDIYKAVEAAIAQKRQQIKDLTGKGQS